MKTARVPTHPRAPWNLSLWTARAARSLIRWSGRSGGTTLPGRVLTELRPDAIEKLSERIPGGSIIVSSTNGKTTTSSMIASILDADSRPALHNKAGSNMHWGVATTLLDAVDLPDEAMGLFEIDEAWVSRLAPALDPKVVVLGNLFRDQLDRYGELERLSDEWAEMVSALPADCTLVLCADDPSIARLADSFGPDRRVVFFGMEDPKNSLSSQSHAFDTSNCRNCGARYEYERTFVGHLGHYRCPNCDSGRPSVVQVRASSVDLHGFEGSTMEIDTPQGQVTVELALPGLYNSYNALAAVAAACALGVEVPQIEEGLEGTTGVFGRSERIHLEGGELSMLLIKNPTGANEVIRTLADEATRSGKLDLWFGLNDGIADGRDISWIWDTDFELLAGCVRSAYCSGSRAPEMALRLKYAGWPTESIAVDHDLERSLTAAVDAAPGILYAMPTYTALLDVRNAMAQKGDTDHFWV